MYDSTNQGLRVSELAADNERGDRDEAGERENWRCGQGAGRLIAPREGRST